MNDSEDQASKTVEIQAADTHAVEIQVADARATGTQVAAAGATDTQVANVQPVGTQVADARVVDMQVADAHLHVAFIDDPLGFISEAAHRKSFLFAMSVTPEEYERCYVPLALTAANKQMVSNPLTARFGLGLHSWWVPMDAGLLDSLLKTFDVWCSRTPFIGEVGLDFSARRVATKKAQQHAFQHIMERCVSEGNKVISLHCVHAYDEMLSVLEQTKATETNACIFHWFSGSSEQLQKARQLGCYFSVSERMLATGKGREYVKTIPPERLLLETDAPFVKNPEVDHPRVEYSFSQINEELQRTMLKLAELRNLEASYLSAVIVETTKELLCF